MKQITRIIFLGAFVVFAPFFLEAHPLHLSVATVEQRACKLDIRIKVFASDLLLISSVYHKATSDLQNYFDKHFIITNEGVQSSLSLQNINDSADVVFIYLRAELKSRNTTIHIRNSILFEYFDDQTNLILYTSEKQSEGYKCTPKTMSIDINP